MNTADSLILIVDDNEDDVYALRRALKKANVTCEQRVVTHGEEAVEYLSGQGKYADRVAFPLPNVVFLDLKIPLLDGFEVLSWIKEQPQLDDMRVAILSGSDELNDHRRATELGAHSYLVKPPTPEQLLQLLGSRGELGPPSDAAVE